jgi:hypothetical protein
MFQRQMSGFHRLDVAEAYALSRTLRIKTYVLAGRRMAAPVKKETPRCSRTAAEARYPKTNRRVDWPWGHAAPDRRSGNPGRFELAAWSGATLCGLALGRPSNGPSHLSIHFTEGNPDPAHPLRGKILPIVLAAGLAYAIALGKQELRLVLPLPALIPLLLLTSVRVRACDSPRASPISPAEHNTMTNAYAVETRPPATPAAAGEGKRKRATQTLPSLAEAVARLKQAAGKPQPWLQPAALAACADAPEVLGPPRDQKTSAD